MRLRRAWLGVVALATVTGAAGGALAATATATATPAVVSWVASNPNPINIDLNGQVSASIPVTAALDGNCPQALVNGHSYNIVAVSADTSIATFAPDTAGPFNCGSSSTTNDFTATGLQCGATSVTLSPVVNPNGKSDNQVPGIQHKLGAVTVDVNVTDSQNLENPLCNPSPPPPPPPGENPAAPAVANAYLNGSKASDQDVWNACQAAFHHDKNWRGELISFIAHWMPLPESIKDNASIFPADAWTNYVDSEVNHLCGGIEGSPGTDWPIPVEVPPLPAYTP